MKNSAACKLGQVPEGYLIVGVDPHQKKHAAVAITQDLKVGDRLKFDKTVEGFDFMLRRVRAEMVKAGCRGVMFSIEAGGHYWRNLAYFLDRQGIPFRFISPYSLKRRREGKDLNRRKNDYRDAEVAAQLMCTAEFVETRLPKGVYAELRAARSAYRRLVKERTRTLNLMKSLLDGLFPEFRQIFKDPCAVTAISVLSSCAIPATIAAMAPDEFVSKVEPHYRGNHLMRRKLVDLHRIAHNSIGVPEGADSVASEVMSLVEKLELIRKQTQLFEKRLVRLVDQTEEGKYLLSITGLNYITVSGLLAELGCFKLYRTSKQMIKMAGINPIESESGGKRGFRTPMSKKGRPALRCYAWLSIISMLKYNADFREWARQRRERPAYANPMSRREVIGAASSRLLRLAFALVKNQDFYRSPQTVTTS